MPLIRRLLGESLQEAFDLDRETGPRWLQQDAVYLFSDPLQGGYAFAQPVLRNDRDVSGADDNIVVSPSEGHSAIVKAFSIGWRNISGGSKELTFGLNLHWPQAGSAFTLIDLWSATATLANNETFTLRVDDLPWLLDYRLPQSASIRYTFLGATSGDVERDVKSLMLQYPSNTFLEK